ncbi:extracellular solute-binding protein [Rhodoferax sp.]|uniref:extracellular solute-binding protein n=1 Tax=Rhodoferax sp. TaxID=50421 RepID=UPI00283E9296|nr:extracellular solute-binding protein [Rhodoferax sp.]MDR3368267.1 extracellular solute-binding protein [Rhodoferax sp.]
MKIQASEKVSLTTRNRQDFLGSHTCSARVAATVALLINLILMSFAGAGQVATYNAVPRSAATTISEVGIERPNPTDTRSTQLPTDKTPHTINWMGHWYKADKRYDLVLEMAREFSFRHQDTHVNLQFPEQIVGTNDKVVVAHLIADMIKHKKIDWDIVWMDNLIYQFVAEELNDPLWGRKHLVDFKEVSGFVQSQKPFIIEDPAYRNQTGGILVGPYIEGYYYALYYNSTLAAKVGIQVKPFGMTFEDLLGYVKAAAQYNQTATDKIPIFFDAHDMPSMEVLFQNLVKSWIADYGATTTEQSSPKKLEAMYKGFQAFEELGKYMPLIPSYASNAWFLTRDVPLNDKALFYISGTWMYSRWRDIDVAKSTKMIPTELPVFKPVNYGLGGVIPAWAVMKDSPHREAAIRLIMSMSTPRIAEKWVQYTKTPTGIAGDFSKATIGGDVYEVYQRTLSEKYGNRVQYSFNAAYLIGKNNSLLQKDIVDILWKLLEGKMTADQAQRSILVKMK